MSIFAISDLHLSFSDEKKSMEVFEGWKGYTEKLKENWERKIKDKDTVVIVGDISWAMTLENAKYDLKFINDLPGKKILIKGNHDFWWSTSKKVNDFLKENDFNTISILYNSALEVENICICGSRGWMFRSETDQDKKIFMRELGRIERSIDQAYQLKNLDPIVFLHYPRVYANEESKEIINLLIEKKVKRCYYGHIHGSGALNKVLQGSYKGIDFRLVSCDYVNFCPVPVNNI